ncbi:hypothetical protein VE04_03208 [Pseudogymnoascus sp. 24MN13]|nr:hypothetical protein VE04_03208 [Pseudogymnoascus sp. 24MN13]
MLNITVKDNPEANADGGRDWTPTDKLQQCKEYVTERNSDNAPKNIQKTHDFAIAGEDSVTKAAKRPTDCQTPREGRKGEHACQRHFLSDEMSNPAANEASETTQNAMAVAKNGFQWTIILQDFAAKEGNPRSCVLSRKSKKLGVNEGKPRSRAGHEVVPIEMSLSEAVKELDG